MAIETLVPARGGSTPWAGPIDASWLGRMDYREGLALQKRLAAERADGTIGDRLLLLEHPRVLTLGRAADPAHIRATPATLAARSIEVIQVERGGEVTYHGPGQLVAYPIIALTPRGLMVRPLVRALEAALVVTCAAFGVEAARRDGHPGCWCDPDGDDPRKIGALGLRIERGVSYHGIALNLTVDLADFELIDACGMPGVTSTSLEAERERAETTAQARTTARTATTATAPAPATVEHAATVFATAFAAELGAPLTGI